MSKDDVSSGNPQRLILVDGSSYLFRAYHALPPLTNKAGMPTGAIYGVINMLRKLLKEYQPQLLAVVFDCKEKTARHFKFPEYKANRTVMPDDLAVQIQPLHAIIQAMGLPLLAIPGIEADDVIGTLAYMASAAGLETVISTGDKDMAQLVDEKITLVNTMSETVLDRAGVIAKFGLPPEQIIDYLSLIGDTVDNIPGIYKVGPKTAVKWLEQYHSLDGVIAHAPEIGGKVGEYLRNDLEKLPLYRDLVTIDTQVALPYQVRDLQIGTANIDELRHWFTELEFNTWLQQLGESSQQQPQKRTYRIIYTADELEQYLLELASVTAFAIDTETTSLDYMQAELVGISLCAQAGRGVYIPVGHVYVDMPQQLPLDYVLQQIKPLLQDDSKLKICHNLKYDMEILANYGLHMAGPVFDTMLASYVINSVASRHNMDALALEYLNTKTITYEDVAGKGAKQINFAQVSIERAAEYAAEDADITWQLYQVFVDKLMRTESLETVFQQIEMPLVPVLVAMERRGVLIDVQALQQQSIELAYVITKLEQEAYALAGGEFNLGSPKQLQEILFGKLKLPVLEKTATGQASTSEAVLQELAQDFALPRVILEYRSLSKLKTTYTDKLPLQVDVVTGRVHTSYHQAVTATGRLSSSDPNLQNIPIRTAEGKKIRSAFVAPAEYKLVAADYSQIELRIMAHLSEDKNLLAAFARGLDIHRMTASEVFAVPLDQVTEEQRRHAKAINFGLIYGMSAFGLAKQLGIERAQAEAYIDTYFTRFPGVLAYMNETRKFAHEHGYVHTLFGRRLYLPEINTGKFMVQKAAERAAINAPLQGAQSDIIKIAMINLHNWIQQTAPDVYMIMQVHDELVFEIPQHKVDVYVPTIVNIMQNAAQLTVALEVSIGVGDNWGAV